MTIPRQDLAGDAAYARAFALGCDARYAGQPRTTCPYHGYSNCALANYWRKGWDHIDKEWATEVRGRDGFPRWKTNPPAPVRDDRSSSGNGNGRG